MRYLVLKFPADVAGVVTFFPRRFNIRLLDFALDCTMETHEVVPISAAVAAISMIFEDEEMLLVEESKRKHRFWMRSWMLERYDGTRGNTMYKFQQELLQLGDIDEFRATLRMPPDVYQELLEIVRPYITKHDTNYRRCIPAEERLSMTMRYLALGDCYRTLRQMYRVGLNTVGRVVRETSVALYKALQPEYLVTPSTTAEWLKVAEDYEARWNVPHALGALDGKHIRIACPPASGSFFYNYKRFYSIILMGLVNADYEFIFVDVGAEGKASDGGVWKKTSLFELMTDPDNPMQIPEPSHIEGLRGFLPYFVIGDDAFTLSMELMKPFPPLPTSLDVASRICNYRLSRGRMCIEDAFGILTTRFRIFRREIEMRPDGAEKVVMATIVLHNFLHRKCGKVYMPLRACDYEDEEHRRRPGLWRKENPLDNLEPSKIRKCKQYASNMRVRLANYFLTKEGEVTWQYTRYLEKH